MSISVTDPISPALSHTKRVLFKPFDISKWFVLGFCAWLAQLVEGGCSFPSGGGGGGGGGPGGGGGGRAELNEAWEWVLAEVSWLVPLVIGLTVLFVAIGVVIAWLRSRGAFMFLDGVVHNRAAVKAPWREYARDGNSLFWFNVLFGLASFAGFLLIAGVSVLIALPDIQSGQFGGMAITAIVVFFLLALLLSVVAGCISVLLGHFVVPIMYLRRQGIRASGPPGASFDRCSWRATSEPSRSTCCSRSSWACASASWCLWPPAPPVAWPLSHTSAPSFSCRFLSFIARTRCTSFSNSGRIGASSHRMSPCACTATTT